MATTTTPTAAQKAALLSQFSRVTNVSELNRLQSQAQTMKVTVPTSTLNAARANIAATDRTAKAAADKARADKLAAEQAAARAATEAAAKKRMEDAARAQQEDAARRAAEKAAADKAAAEKAAAEKAAAEKAAAERAAAEQKARETAERIAAEKAAAEQKAEQARQEAARLAAEKAAAAEQARAERQRIAAEQAAAEKAAAEKAAQERAAAAAKAREEADARAAVAKQKATTEYTNWMRNPGSEANISRLMAMARQDGIEIPQDVIDAGRKQVAGEKLGEKYQQDLGAAKTQEQYDAVLQRAQAEGAIINPGYTEAAQRRIVGEAEFQKQKEAEKTRSAAQASWVQQVNTAADQGNVGQVQSLIEQAKSAGQWNLNDAVSDGFVRAAQTIVNTEQGKKTAAAQSEWVKQAAAAQTPDEAKSIIDQAKAAGQWNLNDAMSDGFVQSAQRIVDQAAEQQRSTAQQGWVDQVNAAKTSDEARSLIQQARAAGQWNINDAMSEGFVQAAQGRVEANLRREQQNQQQIDYELRLKDQAAASQSENAKFAAGLAKPTGFVNKFTPNGTEIQGRPDNPATPEDESGWYVPTADGLQRVDSDGKLSGPAIPDYNEFNQMADTQRQETQAFEQQQREQTRALAASTLANTVKDFEAALPSIDDFRKTGASILRGPDSSEYFITPPNLKTGEPSRWVKLPAADLARGVTDLATGKNVNLSEFDKQWKTIENQNNEVYQAERLAQIEAQRRANEGPGFKDFFKTLAIMAIAAVALPYISKGISAISNAFSGAGAAGAAGATGEAAAVTASNMASAGASTAEISAALQAQGLNSAAASAAANAATGITTGTVSSSGLLASSGISADMIALANSTLDPIAALNAAAGWTSVDVAYLASIGAPASLITKAQATNVAMGFDPYGLTELSAAETAALESNIDPDLINRFQDPNAALEAGRAGGQGSGTYFDAQGRLVVGDAATAVDATAGLAGPAGSNAAFEAALANAGAAAPVAPGAVASSVINPVTGLLETVIPGVGTSPVASVVLSAPAAAAAGTAATTAAGALSPSVLAALGGGAAVLGGLAGGGGAAAGTAGATAGATAPAATTPVVQPAPGGGTVTTYPDGSTLTQAPNGAVTDGGGTAAGTATTTPPAAAPGGTTAGTSATAPVAPPGMIETVVPGTGSTPVASVTLTPAPVVPPAVVAPGLTPGEMLGGGLAIGGVAGGTAGGVVGGTATTTPVVQPAPGGGTVTTYPDGSTLTQDAAGTVVDGGGTAAGTTVTNNPVTGMTETVTPGTGTSPVANVTLTPTPGPAVPGTTTGTAGTGAGVVAGGAAAGSILGGSTAVPPPAPVAPTPPPDGLPPVQDAVATPNPNYTNPPPPSVPEALGDLAGATVDAATGMSASDLAKIAAGWVVINGILTPPVPEGRAPYGPIDPTVFGTVGKVNLPGTNPGFFTNVPAQYQTTSPVQSKFYWGQHPYQTGARFSPEQYRQVPAPAVPFGLQQMYTPESQSISTLLAGVRDASGQAPFNIPQAPRV
jgi:hypothetical protein